MMGFLIDMVVTKTKKTAVYVMENHSITDF